MLNSKAVELLQHQRNLLAFSGGSDSTALFFLLLDAGISFDIALVNYHTRATSDDEAAYALDLATRYGLHCHLYNAPAIDANFEHEARTLRYDFFLSLIRQEGYDHLITAHHLNDRLEWLLMRLCKGAGLVEMAGMKSIEVHETYTLVRPLLQTPKQELIHYLQEHQHQWFEDESNADLNHTRNYFRHHYAQTMIKEFSQGIQKSFTYLDEDVQSLEGSVTVNRVEALSYFLTPDSRRTLLVSVDRTLKQQGFLMRQGDKETLKQSDTVVVGRRYVVAVGAVYTFIAPYTTTPSLEKAFKERCRQLRIEPKLRPYLFQNPQVFDAVALLLDRPFSGVNLHGK